MNEFNQDELHQRTQEYINYINEHKANVKEAWKIIEHACNVHGRNSWMQQNSCNCGMFIDELIEKHDLSKFDVEEFLPYRKRFFPSITDEPYDSDEFEKAWQHHKDNNLHHWESMKAINYDHWMILEYTVEMICDWLAMAMKFNEKHRAYWNKNKDKIKLAPWQVEFIEEIYTTLDMYYEDNDWRY